MTRSKPSLISGIEDTRVQIAKLRTALLSSQSSESLTECLPGLSQAASRLVVAENELCAQDSNSSDVPLAVFRDLKSLQAELRAAASLVQYGAEFHRGWARLLGVADTGYTITGEAASLTARGTVAIQG